MSHGVPKCEFATTSEKWAADYASAKGWPWTIAFAERWPPGNPVQRLSNTKWNARPRA